LYLIHWPFSIEPAVGQQEYVPNKGSKQNFVPLSETWAAMEELVEKKQVRSIGISNFNIQLTLDLLSYAKIKPQVNQVELHPLLTQEQLRQASEENGILISAYCPLGGQRGGLASVLDIDVVKSIAKKHNKTPAQIVLRWSIQVGLNPLPKSAKLERIESNFAIFDFELSEEEVKQVSAANQNQRFNDPATWGPGWLAIFG